MHFVKAHGTGNDFVLLPDLDGRMELTPGLARALCQPHVGLGADGVIRLAPPTDDGDDVFMDYRNADGSLSEMCGNGVRCVAKFLIDRGVVTDDVVRVGSRGGTRRVQVVDRDADGKVATARVDMGRP
jgi:diaminopimelate epimerase